MKTKDLNQTVNFAASQDDLFSAWLDSTLHGKMIDADAEIEPKVGGKFSIWDGYLTGVNQEIDPVNHRIVQSWRDNSTDWPKDYYSQITLEFLTNKSNPNHTLLRFSQTGVPDKYADDIAKGWEDYYWAPMKRYFVSE